MTEANNLGKRVTPSVVPASHVRDFVNFETSVPSDLRNRQAAAARDYGLIRINALELQRRKGKRQEGPNMVNLDSRKLAELEEDIYTYRLAMNKLAEGIAETAGDMSLDLWSARLPSVFEQYVSFVRDEREVKVEVEVELEQEPVQIMLGGLDDYQNVQETQ